MDRELSVTLTQANDACSVALDILRNKNDYNEAHLEPMKNDLIDIQTDYKSILALMYTHATTLGIAFKPPSTPAGAIRPLKDLSTDISNLVGCVQCLRAGAHGKTLHREATWRAQEIIEAVHALLQTFLASKWDESPKQDKTYLMRIGALHSAIDFAKKDLSMDNTAAILSSWKSHSNTLADALAECEELQEESRRDSDGTIWGKRMTNDIAFVLLMCAVQLRLIALIRLVSVLHQRVGARHIVASLPNTVLDSILETSDAIGSAVDDLVSSLYAPQDLLAIKGELDGLEGAVASLQKLLNSSWEDELSQSMAAVSLERTDDASPSKDRAWLIMCFQQIKQSIDAIR
ncbi:hypothetical protein BS47DRAFT_1488465 [Hydnum rufescens UP504]|uniref:Cyclin-D1-binding protein 1-like N-terminal domain-containing protein n=1 Tax=Hydnum rufescens UP504 TaxID=1448309 RepID=A0A9P6DMU1_9AGAM|nr:hypothetical protein BS47DRAFT_1488465 [Hydnum rufescens UP504]